MEHILFALPGNEVLADRLASLTGAETGSAQFHRFPDEEVLVRIDSDVKNKRVTLVCTLDRPDAKFLPLYFLAQTARDMGAATVRVVAPYLAYMRQDKRFHQGEALSSSWFGHLVSGMADELLTIDPHLHRHHNLAEVFSIPAKALHAAPLVSEWIRAHVKNPLLIGPDEESEQWVSEVARMAGASFAVLKKIRHDDNHVTVSLPDADAYRGHTPVLVDDIISTAHTMMETVGHLRDAALPPPVCIGVHAVFAGDAYERLLQSGVASVVTCNTIVHPSNRIDISSLFADHL
ncbi:MAG: ribose-phosphate pyrophosphokinase [Flavobacteriales bacterium]|nr:ribose-phosphate pyrophosphokinase [Flavobacteriales bacterium]MCB9447991.1 ribose-phosphate pyrophosphokinase [Flavobacteriales bacterium]